MLAIISVCLYLDLKSLCLKHVPFRILKVMYPGLVLAMNSNVQCIWCHTCCLALRLICASSFHPTSTSLVPPTTLTLSAMPGGGRGGGVCVYVHVCCVCCVHLWQRKHFDNLLVLVLFELALSVNTNHVSTINDVQVKAVDVWDFWILQGKSVLDTKNNSYIVHNYIHHFWE